MKRFLVLLLLLSWPGISSLAAQEVDRAYLLEHYTKYEHQVPMRDGVRLHTTVYAPKDDHQAYPLLLTRTPYSVRPYSPDAYPEPRGVLKNYARDGFIFVFQDVRGRNGSEGEFVHMRPHLARKSAGQIDESTDTYDSIDWLVRNVPGNNGRVGLLGLSYPGFYAAAGMIDSHPALKAVSPQAPIADWFAGDDFHQGGAFGLAKAFGFFSLFGQTLDDPKRQQWTPFDFGTADGYRFFLGLGPISQVDAVHFKGTRDFWREMMSHGTYDDFWRQRDLRPHLRNVRAAVLTVGGWYDAENLFGALEVYRSTERNNAGISNTLVMGPWSHGAWMMGQGASLGPVRFHAETSEYFRRRVELPFLEHHLKGGPDPGLPEALAFETGTMQWRRHATWPPKHARTKTLSLASGGRLSFSAAPAGATPAYDEYVSDPDHPVPFTQAITTRVPAEYMVGDQRFAATRPDVLVYRTEVLEEDVTLAGPVQVRLRVSTTGTDADWVVKLVDVYSEEYPDTDTAVPGTVMAGYQQLVRGMPMRAKFRTGLAAPQPMVPDAVTELDFSMPDVYHTFRRGHRIMVQIQSSWFPLFDRNPQVFTDIYRAERADFRKSTQRVYHSYLDGSRLEVGVLPSH